MSAVEGPCEPCPFHENGGIPSTPATLKIWGWPMATLPMLMFATNDALRAQFLHDSPIDATGRLVLNCWPCVYMVAAMIVFICAIINRWDGRAQVIALLTTVGVSALRTTDIILTLGWSGIWVASTFALVSLLALWTFIWIPPQRARWKRTR